MKIHHQWAIILFVFLVIVLVAGIFFTGNSYTYRYSNGTLRIEEVPRWIDSTEQFLGVLPNGLRYDVLSWTEQFKKEYWTVGHTEYTRSLSSVICENGLVWWKPRHIEAIPRGSNPFTWAPPPADIQKEIKETFPDLNSLHSWLEWHETTGGSFCSTVIRRALQAASYDEAVAEYAKLYRSYNDRRDNP